MEINPSETTENSGKIVHSYLRRWDQNFSNITGLLGALISAFNITLPIRTAGSRINTQNDSPQYPFGINTVQPQSTSQVSIKPQLTQSHIDEYKYNIKNKFQEEFKTILESFKKEMNHYYENEQAVFSSLQTSEAKKIELSSQNKSLDSELSSLEAQYADLLKWEKENTDKDQNEVDLIALTSPETVLERQYIFNIQITFLHPMKFIFTRFSIVSFSFTNFDIQNIQK